MNDELATAKRRHVVIRTLHAVAQPMARRYDRHYHPRHRHGHIHLILDTVMVALIAILVVGVIAFVRINPSAAPLSAPPHVEPPSAVLTVNAGVRLTTLEGDPLWSGPLPLVAGRQTRLRIFFNLSGIQKIQRHLVLTAAVVAPAMLTEHASVNRGSLTMADGHIRWDIGTESVGATNAQASIEVALTPTPDDVGKALPLLTAATLTGENTLTNTPIAIVIPAVSTATLSNNLGIVTKE